MNFLKISAIVLLLAGCTHSNIASYADRSGNNPPFSHLIVVASNLPLGERQAAEAIMADAIRNTGAQATLGTDVMPPTRLQDREYINNAVASSGADGILIIYEKFRDTQTAYIPPTVLSGGYAVHTGTIRGYGSVYTTGNYATYQDNATFSGTTTYHPPTVFGGFNVQKPVAGYGAAVYDLRRNGIQVWIAEVESRGSAFDDYEALAADASASAVEQLRKDGLLY